MRPRARSRTDSASSVHVPGDLPDIVDVKEKDDREAQWERRATILAGTATGNTTQGGGSGGQVDGAGGGSSRPITPLSVEAVMDGLKVSGGDEEMNKERRSRRGSVSDPRGDVGLFLYISLSLQMYNLHLLLCRWPG